MRATALNQGKSRTSLPNGSGRDPVPLVEAAHRASLRALLALCSHYMRPADLKLVRSAYKVANAAHSGVRRRSGEAFIEHPLAVARVLAEFAIDAQGIAAALLHDTVEDTSLTLEDVREQFGDVIANIVDGVTKFSAVELTDARHELDEAIPPPDVPPDDRAQRDRKAREQVETVRKLFLAMGQEPRVVLLKLADRLHNLRTLEVMSRAQREAKSRETLEIFAPLAGRVGLYNIKTELEDLAFSYLHPDEFAHTQRRLREETARHAEWSRRMCERMEHELAERGINAVVIARVKRPYRAWVESQDSGMDVSLLHDLFAFRVLTLSVEMCYQALGVIHHLWHPHDDRIRDYIATPKVNGYRSLHTAVFALDGRLAQIHIRTHAMHRSAQHGVAAIWLERAALGATVDPQTPLKAEDVPTWVTQLATWHNELGLSAADFVATLRGDLLEEQIFVFTPKGDIRELPAGSTVLDLAYAIHTKVGDHAAAAWVQTNTSQGVLVAREVPIEHVLHTGDVVRVVTDADAQPAPEWLQSVRTRYAREKIARSLRVLRRAEAEAGSDRRFSEAPVEPDTVAPPPLMHPSGAPAVIELGRCCDPCPGDTIVGVVRLRRAVTIHRMCCRALKRTLARRRARGRPFSQPLHVSWPEIHPAMYRARLLFVGQDHEGLMHELSVCAARQGLNVSASRADANQARYKAAVSLTLDLPADVRLDGVMRRFQTVPGIVSVTRDTSPGCEKTSDQP